MSAAARPPHNDGFYQGLKAGACILWPLAIICLALEFTGASPGAITMGIAALFWAAFATIGYIVCITSR